MECKYVVRRRRKVQEFERLSHLPSIELTERSIGLGELSRSFIHVEVSETPFTKVG